MEICANCFEMCGVGLRGLLTFLKKVITLLESFNIKILIMFCAVVGDKELKS